MIADGKYPDAFKKLDRDAQSRLETRAQEIKDKGPYKDRKQPDVMLTAPLQAMATKPATSEQYAIHVDSKAGAGYKYRAYVTDK